MISNNFSHLKKQKMLEREISFILYQLIQQENLSSCSISYSDLSPKGENLKIFLNFSQEKETTNLPQLLNQKYLSYVKKKLIRSKKFTYMPQIKFFVDKNLVKINELEKLLNNTK